jgi:threonine synthase
LRAQRVIGKNESVVCNITGNGLKQPAAVGIPEAALKPIAPTLDALMRRVESSGLKL